MRWSRWLAAVVAAALPIAAEAEETAIFAAGCFWCLDDRFSRLDGVTSVETGYLGGAEPDPSHEDVALGRTGHMLAARVTFDPEQVSYGALLDAFWSQVDPTDAGGQFCERGPQFRAAIFPLDQAQFDKAEASRAEVERRLERPLAVELRSPSRFWPAPPQHQDFARQNPRRFDFFRRSCGIDEELRRIWGNAPPPQPR